MILRLWHGWTTVANAGTYERLLRSEVLPGIHRVDGYHGAYLLRREAGGEVEFVTLTLFDSLEAVRAFAGEDHEVAVVPPPHVRCSPASMSTRSTTRSCSTVVLRNRSYLYVAGHDAAALEHAFGHGADAVVLDLEDGVPVERREEARHRVATVLWAHWACNPTRSAAAVSGLEVVGSLAAGIRLPKTASSEDARWAVERIAGLPLICWIESRPGSSPHGRSPTCRASRRCRSGAGDMGFDSAAAPAGTI